MELSNRTLALLLVAAIVISIGGTMVNLEKLNRLTGPTGYALSAVGNVSLSITETTSIVLTYGEIDFGSGYVFADCNNCTMDTAAGGTRDATCCLGDWADVGNFDEGLLIENQGNTYVSLKANYSEAAADFIGGDSVTPEFDYQFIPEHTANHGSANGDDSASSCQTGWNNTGGWTAIVANTQQYACGSGSLFNFTSEATKDEVELNFRVVIPENADTGAKAANVTITAASS